MDSLDACSAMRSRGVAFLHKIGSSTVIEHKMTYQFSLPTGETGLGEIGHVENMTEIEYGDGMPDSCAEQVGPMTCWLWASSL